MEVSRFSISPRTTSYRPNDRTRMLLWLQDNLSIMDGTTIPQMVRESIIPGMTDKEKNNALLALKRMGLIEFICRGNQYRSPKDYFINYTNPKFPRLIKKGASQESIERSKRLKEELDTKGQPVNFRGKPVEIVPEKTIETTPTIEPVAPIEEQEPIIEEPKKTTIGPQVEVPLNLNDLAKGGFSLTLNINFTINK